ncbi:MAG: HAD family hydrolase [Rhodospirillales bacterium]
MNASGIRAVLWDIDGTLIDSEPLHLDALLSVSAGHGVDLSNLPDNHFLGVQMNDVWKALRPQYPEALTKERWLADINDYYAQNSGALSAMPEADETIRALSGLGLRQAAVSNSFRAVVDANLNCLEQPELIEFSISLDDVTMAKPDPEPYASACERLNLPASAVMAVEDSLTGLRSARAAGLHAAAFNCEAAPDGCAHISRLSQVAALAAPQKGAARV